VQIGIGIIPYSILIPFQYTSDEIKCFKKKMYICTCNCGYLARNSKLNNC